MQTKLSPNELAQLQKLAKETRINILKMIYNAKSGHLGGNFSAVELILTLYKKVLKHDKNWKNSKDFANRDRFVLSKGHASAALYSFNFAKTLSLAFVTIAFKSSSIESVMLQFLIFPLKY